MRESRLSALGDGEFEGEYRAAAQLAGYPYAAGVGFDDTIEAQVTYPPLTTVRQPLKELGSMAVSLLFRLLGEQWAEPLHVELATRLVVRSSTAASSLS